MADGFSTTPSVGQGVRIRNLTKIFGRTPKAFVEPVRQGMTKAELLGRHGHVLGLRNVDIDVPAGTIQVIMGLSGSGKSTLIRHVNRLIDPTAGEVVIGAADVVTMTRRELQEFRRHQTAMVFQKFALLPHRTVLENAAYGLEIQGVPRARRHEAAMGWLERVGLRGFGDRYPNQLSGGMQQRVGLARALATNAPILLMDEAYSALDPLIRMDMQTMLLELQRELRKTVLFITHDLDEALRLGDQIAILRDGEVIQQGTSQDIVLRPADDYVSRFVAEVNRGRVLQAATVMEPVPAGTPPAGPRVEAHATLEAAARLLLGSGAPGLAVTDAEGGVIGQLDLRRMMAAMVTPLDMAEDPPAPEHAPVAPPVEGAVAALLP